MPIFRKIFYVSYPIQWNKKTINISLKNYTWLKDLCNEYQPVYFAGGLHDQHVLQRAEELYKKLGTCSLKVVKPPIEAYDEHYVECQEVVEKRYKIRQAVKAITESPIYKKDYYMIGYNTTMILGRIFPTAFIVPLLIKGVVSCGEMPCPVSELLVVHVLFMIIYRGLSVNVNAFLDDKGYFPLRHNRLEYERNINILKYMIKSHDIE